jgi:DNA topoisomerase-1
VRAASQHRRTAVPKTLVIVESPNKAKKLAAFLGRDYVVKASFGHVADLPAKDYGVDLATLEESYVVRDAKVVKALQELVAKGGFDRVLLASDPDREGEAIAWHLARQLKVGGRGSATRCASSSARSPPPPCAPPSPGPRPIDAARVDAQRSRRVLDRIVGFDCSKEICWPAGAQSAGRCQTPALHLLCEREREILAFVARTYWTLEAAYAEGLVAFVPPSRRRTPAPRRRAGGRRGGADGRERKGRLVPRQFATREEAERCSPRRAPTRTSCATCRRGAPSAARRRRTPPRRCSRTPAASCA